jgi:hypothetical protein
VGTRVSLDAVAKRKILSYSLPHCIYFPKCSFRLLTKSKCSTHLNNFEHKKYLVSPEIVKRVSVR